MISDGITYCENSNEWIHHLVHGGLLAITNKSYSFVKERNWDRHDTIMNLTLALSSEIGELADVLAWIDNDIPPSQISRTRDKMSQELADIIIILVRLAGSYAIDAAKDLLSRSTYQR